MFNERSHAHIALQFYRHLNERFGDRGVRAFNHGTQNYAMQRGRRMAQRAIRDGKELTYETYCQYGEWINTDYVKNEGSGNQSVVHSVNPDYELEITVCPWHEEFKSMGEVEGGYQYCKYLDESIARGFNPDVIYEVSKTLHRDNSCIHRVKDANFDVNADTNKKMEYVKDFEYHCAHSYWSYAEVTESIFGSEGRKLCTDVLVKLSNRYGNVFSNKIMEYKYVNFNVI